MNSTPQTRRLAIASGAALIVCLMVWVALGFLAGRDGPYLPYLLNLLATGTVIATSGIFVAVLRTRPPERDDGRRARLAEAYAQGHADGLTEGHAKGYAEGVDARPPDNVLELPRHPRPTS